jgi:intermediate peptidase
LTKRQTLKRAIEQKDIYESFSPQEQKVAQLLKTDFEKSAIHMPLAKRKTFIELNDRINDLGHEFISRQGQDIPLLNLKKHSHTGLSESVLSYFEKNYDSQVYLDEFWSTKLLRLSSETQFRDLVWKRSQSATEDQLDILEEMLKCRGQLALLLGFSSYGHMWLKDKMAKSPGKDIFQTHHY